MIDYNFNFEIRSLLRHFVAAFNDVTIKRFDGSKFEKERIKVPFVYSPKSHILQDIIGQADAVRIPIMAAEITGQGRDNERVKNKHDDIVYRKQDGSYVNLHVIPWNITIEMTILAKYQEDMEQIVHNFATHTNPYAIIEWQEPKSGRGLRTEVLWDGDMKMTYPGKDQTPKDPPFRVTGSTSFVIKGYLLDTNIQNNKPICFINNDIIFTDKFYCNYETLVANTSGTLTESFSITGRPVLRYVAPYYLKKGDNITIDLQGTGLDNLQSIYVSGSNPNMFPLTEYQPFSGVKPFKGFLVNDFNKISFNEVSFTLPSPSAIGFVDIIGVNSCGYGKLTEDANRCNRVENPYSVTDPDHYSWCVLQYPYLNGLIVSNNLNDNNEIDYSEQIYIVEDLSDTVDKDSIIEKIKELMLLGNVTISELQ